MNNLIFDRTRMDVENALANTSSSEFQKGTYNYTDLNRVESWCKYLKEKFEIYGFNEELQIKTNWSLTNYPTRSEIDRIRENIEELKEFCYALLTEEIIYNNTLDYEQANTLEKILYDIDKYIKSITVEENLKYNIGIATIQNKYITTKVDTETDGSKHIQNLSVKTGIFLIRKKYVTMKGV